MQNMFLPVTFSLSYFTIQTKTHDMFTDRAIVPIKGFISSTSPYYVKDLIYRLTRGKNKMIQPSMSSGLFQSVTKKFALNLHKLNCQVRKAYVKPSLKSFLENLFSKETTDFKEELVYDILSPCGHDQVQSKSK